MKHLKKDTDSNKNESNLHDTFGYRRLKKTKLISEDHDEVVDKDHDKEKIITHIDVNSKNTS